MKKLLFLQPELRHPGGGNLVAVWMLEALKRQYDVTVLTIMPVDTQAINRYYGTRLKASEFQCIRPSFLLRTLLKWDADPHSIQPACLLMRYCKLIKHRYDIHITASNEIDFGTRGIQYVHYPWFSKAYQEANSFRTLSGFTRLRKQFGFSARPWRLLSGLSFERIKANMTLVNSDWVGEIFRERYGAETLTVYPPVAGDFPHIPWKQRENGFVCVGRLSGEKRFEELIGILAQVRKQGHDLHLHIVGASCHDFEYETRLHRLNRIHREWVMLHENLSRSELIRLMSTHRYGIHGMRDEHFGIAVAEFVCAGCLVFVPNSGGQVEIIGENHALLYASDEDAVSKILDILQHEEAQERLRAYLDARKPHFSQERFMQHIQDVVRDFLC
jgi:glycosyltransferase involved in cell wall biosynthesis